MSSIEKQWQLDKLDREEQLQQAEHDKLVQLVKHQMPQLSRIRLAKIYKPTLFRLGQQLESLGNTLQIRYGDLKPRPTE